ncbi:Class E vacuolar protein-sorting machinery protein HSE1 [Ustilago sp. UG-2017a]|nr:Class E vacuolar protein-sorting machinery protein HSE1 [Ustilago sp. UG-2017a]
MFAVKNPFEDIVLKATSEELTSENWELNLEVCDKVSSGGESAARNCVAAIQKRLVHRNANVQLYALTLADAVAKNCGLTAHQELAGRSFTQTLARICLDRNTHATVKKRCYGLVKEWAGEFDDESLGLMKDTYESLKSQDAVVEDEGPSTQPREPTSEQLRAEDEELRRALELSLKDQGGRNAYNSYDTQQAEASGSSAPVTAAAAAASSSYSQPQTSQYSAPPAQQHSTNANASTSAASAHPAAPSAAAIPAVASRVRALYDFSPNEPGELAFSRGEIIRVLDSVYEHWWRGEVRGEAGIFPVNYVEILPDPTPEELQREAEMEARIFSQAADIDRLLNKLRSLDPVRDNLAEDEELQELYQKSLAMRPKIVKLIDRYSNKITELKAMNDKFVHARGSFDEMMEQSLSRYNPAGHSSQDYLRPRPELQHQASASSADYAQHHGYSNPHGYPAQSTPGVPAPHDQQSQYPYNPQVQHGYPQSTGPAPVDPNYGPSGHAGAQPQHQPPLTYPGMPQDQQYQPTPHDDEKRRLYERARAESEAFQQQHFQHPQAHPSSNGYNPGYPSQPDASGLNQQMGNMNIGGSSSYPSHPVGH